MLFKVFTLLSVQFLFISACSSNPKRPDFAKKSIQVGKQKLQVEVANTQEKISYGLMYRTKPLSDSEGMLFIFPKERMRQFWMKNTFIPLSIGFFDRHKKLVHVAEMQAVRSEMEKPKTYSSTQPAMYALEVAPQWFFKNKISLGTKLDF